MAAGSNPRWGRDDRAAPTINLNPSIYGTYAYQFPYFLPQANAIPIGHYPIGANHLPTPQAQQPQQPQHGYAYMSGLGGGNRHPQARPAAHPDLPAANMTNSTGGVGCEPGYNYFFPAEHTKVHVLKCGATPPWQLPTNMTIPFHACHVPVSTTVGELLAGFGANNPNAKMNRVTEVVQGGNGRWYKGISFGGDNDKQMKTTLKELGWDKSRSGLPGDRPVVYLYVTKG